MDRAEAAVEAAMGDVVVARHPFKTSLRVVKRVESIDAGRCTLMGDNPAASTDSRNFGTIPLTDLLGKAVSRI